MLAHQPNTQIWTVKVKFSFFWHFTHFQSYYKPRFHMYFSFLLWRRNIGFLHLWLCFCVVNMLICAMFLDLTYSVHLKLTQHCKSIICQLQIGTCHGYLSSASTRIKQCAVATAELQHPLKGVQGGEQKWSTLCSGKNWQDRYSDRYFLKPILWAQFL